MKKILVFLFTVVITVCGVLTFSGCLPGFFIDSDTDAAKKDLENLIDCLENDDHDGLKNLFAANRVADIESFDEDINKLLVYFDGELESYKTDYPSTDNDIDGSLRRKWYIISADIVTTTETYFLCSYWCELDTSDNNNVGIWSIFIFNYKDNPDKEFTFYPGSWGDKVMDGIHFVKYVDGELVSN